MPSCLSAAWNLASSSRLFCFLMLASDRVELLVAHRPAQLAASLHQQQLVDGRQDQVGRDFRHRLAQLGAGRRHVPQLGPVAQLGHLPLLELGLGDDVAVHLDQDLLEDLRAERRERQAGEERPRAATSNRFIWNTLRFYPPGLEPGARSLEPLRKRPQQPLDPVEHAAGFQGIVRGPPQHVVPRKPRLHGPGGRPGRPPAGGAGRARLLGHPCRPSWAGEERGRAGRPQPPVTGPTGRASATPAAPARRPASADTTLTSRTGSIGAVGLNLMTTDWPSRSMVSTPRRSAAMRMRP